jgi:hypothetical protein
VGLSFARAALEIFGFGSGLGSTAVRSSLLFMGAGAMSGLIAIAMIGIAVVLAFRPDSLAHID